MQAVAHTRNEQAPTAVAAACGYLDRTSDVRSRMGAG